MNPVAGEKMIMINGSGCVMRFTWRALAEIEAMYGDNPNLFNAEILANVASAGLRDKHPDMTPERIMDLSPPLIPFAREVQEVMRWAYFGAESPPPGDEGVKKNHRQDGLWPFLKRLYGRAFRRKTSGT
jgi:hypothetical protein